MQAVYNKIDPKRQLSDSERNISALGAIWQYKMSKNDTSGAAQAAYDLVQHIRLASQLYAAISEAAIKHRDDPDALRAALKKYASVPDGRDMKVEQTPEGQLRYSYVVDQQTGKVIQGGLATPQQLAAQAMNVATKGFDQFLDQMAASAPSINGSRGVLCTNTAPRKRPALHPLPSIDDGESADFSHEPSQKTLNCQTFRIDRDLATTHCD